MKKNYHLKVNQRYAAKVRVLEAQLPYFCTQYFNSKSLSLEKQTEFAYAVDYKTFFVFLQSYRDECKNILIKDIPASIFDKLTEDDIHAYTSYLSEYCIDGKDRHNGDTGIQRKMSSLKSLCKFLLKKGEISRNPIELVDMPKIHKKDIMILNNKEIKRLFDVIEHETGMTDYQIKHNKKCVNRDYAIMMLFLGTGIRISELVGLDVQDVDLVDKTIHITRKGGNQQNLYISDQVADALEKYLGTGTNTVFSGTRSSFEVDKEENALFISRKKNRLSVRAIQKLVTKYSKLAFGESSNGTKLHAHLFRKTYGTNLYLDEGDIKLVADTLGHSSISTTARH